MIVLFSSCKKENDPLIPSTLTNGCKLDFLQTNQEFRAKLTELEEDARKLNYETGYLLYRSATRRFSYEKIEGNTGEASIIFSPTRQLDGIIHSHYGDLYPNFSGSDIKMIYEAYYFEQMNDFENFISVVVFGSGISYLLKITDLERFLNFSKNNLTNRDSFAAFETRYHNIQVKGLANFGVNGSFENALLEMLNTSGLTLYKSFAPYQTWIRLQRDGMGKTQTQPCW